MLVLNWKNSISREVSYKVETKKELSRALVRSKIVACRVNTIMSFECRDRRKIIEKKRKQPYYDLFRSNLNYYRRVLLIINKTTVRIHICTYKHIYQCNYYSQVHYAIKRASEHADTYVGIFIISCSPARSNLSCEYIYIIRALCVYKISHGCVYSNYYS